MSFAEPFLEYKSLRFVWKQFEFIWFFLRKLNIYSVVNLICNFTFKKNITYKQ